jgi:phage gpG-like protein
MIRITVDVAAAQAMLGGVADGVDDLRPAFERMHEIFVRMVSEQFATQGGRTGAWAPLTPRYRAWKARRYPGRPILVRTMRMVTSRRHVTGETVYEVTPTYATFGTRVPYARFHQFGTSRMVVARPILTTADARDMADIVDIVLAHLLRSAREAVARHRGLP